MMSIFASIFGSPKPSTRPPTPPARHTEPQDALAALRQQESQLEKRTSHLETQIKTIMEQADAVIRAGDKTKALTILKKKALLDDQLRSTQGMLDKITHQRLNLELAQVQVQTIKAIEKTNTALKSSGVDVEKAQDAMDDLAEHIENGKEINRLFSEPIPGTEHLGEAAEAELEAMMAKQNQPLSAGDSEASRKIRERVPTPVPDLVSEELRRLTAAESAPVSSESRVALPA